MAETPYIDPADFARLVKDASDDDLAKGFEMNRDQILGEVFGRMEEHFEPTRAPDHDVVIEWRIKGERKGEHDRWQTVIHDRSCRVVREGDEEPRVTFTVAPIDFIRLVTGNASGPKLFLFGKLKIDGDLMLAARIQDMFRMPGP